MLTEVLNAKKHLWIGTAFDKYPELLDGIGMKGDSTRNFESGIFTSNTELVKAAQKQFDDVWLGAHCKGCRKKNIVLSQWSNQQIL